MSNLANPASSEGDSLPRSLRSAREGESLGRPSEVRRLLLVGHEPALSQLASRLLDSSEGANLKLKKGGCCLLSFEDLPSPSNGRLVWWLPPRLLRKLR